MKPKDILFETYASLSANKVRSGLTILGIVIGISSVIAMISIGQGAQSSIQSSIQSIGSNLILVMPGAQRGPGYQVSSGRGSAKTLTLEDVDAISKEVSNISAVSPELSSRYQVTSKSKNTNTQVVGVTQYYPQVRNTEVESGVFINEQNVRGLSKVAVIGPTTKTDLFADEDAIGKTIRIKNIEFKIVGVTKSKGGSGFNNQDDIVYVPLSSAQRYFSGDSYVGNISVQAKDAESMSLVQQDITTLLLSRHNIKDSTLADFNIMNQADIVATASSVTSTFTILLAAVAGISLLVGGIGIMNMMLTTVTERTREIGLRKAVGAKSRDINLQFLSEAVALTFLGGVVGIILGCAIAYGFKYFGILQTTISFYSILLSFGVSTVIGVVFGYYPAKRAGNLNPIQALRYE
jgi:putative ABC transport system permease protein